ncbi:MAG: septum formation initiator family protein [Prevotella sp.]|nr:septum formation initiator family protein [Prevotella sp.]
MWDKKKTKKFFGRFKYVIVIILGLLQILFIGENSMLQRIRYNRQIAHLEEELEQQEAQFLQDSLKLVDLETHPEVIVKIAREKYFMKTNDEDIFMLSDELESEGDETTE